LFEFLEVENNEHKEQVHYQETSKDIPDNQSLTLSDLKIINPSASVLKIISKKILNKYSCVPLFTLLPGSRPVLPRHLRKEYWGYIAGKKNVTLYVAMIDPFNLQVLNIIRSVTEYSVVSIPLHTEAASRFLNEEYEKITNVTVIQEDKGNSFRVGDAIKLLSNNSAYILFFLMVLSGLLSLKLYLKI